MLSILLTTSMSLSALDYEISLGHSKLEHSWKMPNDPPSLYLPRMNEVGLGVWKGNWGVSLFYGDMSRTSDSSGTYPNVDINFKHLYGVDFKYRYTLDKWTFTVGVGTYRLPTDQIITRNGKETISVDSDNDEGFLLSVDYNISKSLSVRYKYQRYSYISKHNEYTSGMGVYLVYKF